MNNYLIFAFLFGLLTLRRGNLKKFDLEFNLKKIIRMFSYQLSQQFTMLPM